MRRGSGRPVAGLASSAAPRVALVALVAVAALLRRRVRPRRLDASTPRRLDASTPRRPRARTLPAVDNATGSDGARARARARDNRAGTGAQTRAARPAYVSLPQEIRYDFVYYARKFSGDFYTGRGCRSRLQPSLRPAP